MSTEEIKKTIIKNYVHGAFNETNIEAFKNIFHPEFSIITAHQENGKLFFFMRDMWEDVLIKRIADTTFDFASIALTPRFRTIDVERDRASATLDLLLQDKVVYTDFLLLMRMNGEWKIVSKVYHENK